MKSKRAILSLIVLLACLPVTASLACTIFCFTHNGNAYFCNNEDWQDPITEIRFYPAKDGNYAWVYLGFANNWPQGGVNEKGLCYDWVAGGGPFGWENDPNKRTATGNLSRKMLQTCANVDEAIEFYKTWNERHLNSGRTFIADAAGNSILVGWKDGQLSIEPAEGQLHSCGVGKRQVDENLQRLQEDFSVDGLASALSDASSIGQYGTKYSNIFSLSDGKLFLFQNRNYDEFLEIDFASKLKEEFASFQIAELFRDHANVSGVRLRSETIDENKQETIIEQVENGLSSTPLRFKGDPLTSIEQRMKHYGVPGMCIAVIEDNQVAWSKAYGIKDRQTGDPVTTNTLFQCASISKPVSALAAMRMVEQGAFDLDTDINQYLKSWTLPDNEFTEQQKVTLRHLISHTGGLTVHGFLGYGSDKKVPSLIEVLNGTDPANSDAIRVDKTPGGTTRYSGGGYCIMQQMMIDATGKSFPELMFENLLEPAGMKHCTFEHPLPATRADEAATGYLQNGRTVSGNRHTYPEMAPAGLYANATELAKFFTAIQMAYQGKSDAILSQAMARKMLIPANNEKEGMALGIIVKNHDGEIYAGHGGWNEGFSSQAVIHLENGYGVVVLTNGNHPPLIEEVIQSVARAYNWPKHSLPAYEILETTSQQIAEVQGRYDHSGSLVEIKSEDGQLLLSSDGSEPVAMHRVGENQFACQTIDRLLHFSAGDESNKARIVFKKQWQETPDPSDIARQLADDERLPAEWLQLGEYEKALAGYQAIQESNPESPIVNEDRLNAFGYQLLGKDQLDQAIGVFRINTDLHPGAFNAFDSLGEAYLLKGEKELGILNYKKSLELNPQNDNAKSVLEGLK